MPTAETELRVESGEGPTFYAQVILWLLGRTSGVSSSRPRKQLIALHS